MGISIDNNNHYFSFLIDSDKNMHLFNSMDEQSLNCDMVNYILSVILQ